MSLTKEECLEAYEVIDTLIHLMCGETREDGYEPTMDETINSMRIIKQLIDKYFDNQPLKFKELKENTWVWDNKTKSYIFIFKPLNWEQTKGIRYANMIIYHSAEGYYMDFEENRLFRYEVKNDHNRKSG